MAISGVSITQDNIINGSNLLPVHSPLVFIVDVDYDGASPNLIYVDISDDDGVLATYRAIPYKDPISTIRQFAFVANDVIKGLMGGFDDANQLDETLVYVDDITKELTLKFYDETNTYTDSVACVFIHGAAQFGDSPNLDAIYNNNEDTYLVPSGSFGYIYFYNDDEANVITIGAPNLQVNTALDYDDEVFTDFDDVDFEIQTQI